MRDEFIIEGNTLIPPFDAIPGLGTNVAIQIVKQELMVSFCRRKIFSKEVKYLKRLSNIWIRWDV